MHVLIRGVHPLHRSQTRKLERLQIDSLEFQVALPWRPPPKAGAARVVVLANGVHAALRYEYASSTPSTCARRISGRCCVPSGLPRIYSCMLHVASTSQPTYLLQPELCLCST